MKKIHVGEYIYCLLSVIYIPFGFFYSFYSLTKLRSYSPFLVSIVYSLMAYSVVPYENWDLARHFNNFNVISNLDFLQSISVIHIRYAALNIVAWFFSNLGINKHFLPFLVVFISYYLVLSVIVNHIRTYHYELNQKYVFYIFFTVLSVFPFFYLASTLRQYLSFGIIFYALYHLIYMKARVKYVFLALIACFIHPSSFIIVIIVIFSYLTHHIHRRRFILVISFFVLVLNYNGFMSIAFSLLKPFLQSINLYFPTYMDFSVINEIREKMAGGEYILNYLVLPSVFFTLLIPFIYKLEIYSNNSERLLKVICGDLFIFISMTSFSIDFLYRYSLVWSLLYMVVFWSSDIFRLSKMNRVVIIATLLFFSIIINIAQINMGKYIIFNSWSELFYKPSVFIFYGNDTEVLQVPK
ncbi:hypothetical protein C7N77_11020 [Aeromonas rivipollensis]|nr:hypothetical protein C7N77_11020 [Aeromonas rivipollensis]